MARPTLTPFIHTIYGHQLLSISSLVSSTLRIRTRYSTSASDKLFADAEREEAELKDGRDNHHSSAQTRSLKSPTKQIEEHENWTGEENIQDAVLRMLMDKYKPLRTGTIQHADEKLKRSPPRVLATSSFSGSETVSLNNASDEISSSTQRLLTPSSGSWTTESLLPSKPGHQPWHTVFKAPSYASASIKAATVLPPSPSQVTKPPGPLDDKARMKEREERRRMQHVTRITHAKESSLDYRLGIRSNSRVGVGPRPINPTSLKGWSGLVEDKIQKARNAGLFDSIKGRGRPLSQDMAESNPFIAREEFLMNRIVQRNGAAPPWVEIQVELDTAVTTFRELLRQSWIRQVTRNLTTENPTSLLHTITLSDIKRHRDKGWEGRERSYHDVAVAELNSLVRKYNGLAPYAVRRPYYSRDVEINKLYDVCVESIYDEIRERMSGKNNEALNREFGESSGGATSGVEQNQLGEWEVFRTSQWRLRDVLRSFLQKIAKKWKWKW